MCPLRSICWQEIIHAAYAINFLNLLRFSWVCLFSHDVLCSISFLLLLYVVAIALALALALVF
jgi:hypothetical protein